MEHDTLQSSSRSNEEQFLNTVFEEVHKFASGDVQNSLLLFPVLLKRERFLTHKVVEENFESFCSFSLGENDLRRTAVCLKSRLILALTTRQCNHEGVHRLALSLCRQQGLPVDFLSYRMKKAATNKTGAEMAQPARPARRQRRPDIQLYVPRGRNLVQEDRTGKRDSDQTGWSTEIRGPGVATEEALPSQKRVARRPSATQAETLDRPSTASVHAGKGRNAPQHQMAPLPGHLHKDSMDSRRSVSDHNEGKSQIPSINTAECVRVQEKAVASGQRDVLGGAMSSQGLPLLLGQEGHKENVTSKHSSVLEELRRDSSKCLPGIEEQPESWNSETMTPPMSLAGMRSASDVQTVQVQVMSGTGETSKLPAILEEAPSKDLCGVRVQITSKAEESLKSSRGEGSLKDIHIVPVQAKSRSDKSSKPPAVSKDASLQDLCKLVLQEGLKAQERLKLPVVLKEVSSSEDIVHSMPVQVHPQNDEALRSSSMSEESGSSKDLHCVTVETKSEPDGRFKLCALSEGPCSLKALPDMPVQAKCKSDETLNLPVASEEGKKFADLNNASLENCFESDTLLEMSTVSEASDSERYICDVPVQVKSENDKTLTPPVISGKDSTLQDSHALPVESVLKSNQTLKPSTIPGEVNSLRDYRDVPGRAKAESDKVPELPNAPECTSSQELYGTSEQSKFKSEALSTSAISDECNLSEDLCAMSEQVKDKIGESLELPSAAEDACSSRGARNVSEQSQFEWDDALKPSSEVTSTNGSTSNSDEQDDQGRDSWDALFDESGECFDPGVLKDITEALGDIKVQHAELDYTKFEPRIPDLSEAEYGHILEIYNFPPEFETKDVVSGLSSSRDQFNIKWVDDTHVLAVFSTPFAATEALSLQTPLMKMRHISEASKQSKLKVKRCSEFLQPFKPRPQTSASVARRLVSGALGLRVQVEPEQRRRELQMLREAKGRRKTAAKQRTDAWNGEVA